MRCSGRWIPRATPLYRSNANERLILKWRRSALYEPYPLTPSLSPSVGEGARRAGERDSAWFMVPMRGRRTVEASHEPRRSSPDFPVGASRRLENRRDEAERVHDSDARQDFGDSPTHNLQVDLRLFS